MTKLTLKNTFIISGIIPACYLFCLSLLFLFIKLREMDFLNGIQMLIIASMIFGILGFGGLVISIISKFEKKYLTKILLLGFGILGFCIFTNLVARKNFWTELLSFNNKENLEGFILWIWPNLVAFILLILNAVKFIKQKTS